ncbi:hypothetical protein PUATCC27989T_00449 [Phytobacter ursingii]|nr:hypothetical protein PUATCC27989T_00449 [Phytobacter ursingii]
MTVVITILASDNSKNRYRARRAAKREQSMQDSSLARKIARSASGSQNVCRATSLGSLRDKPQQEVMHKQTRKYYTDANPFGNKIHAVQKMKLSSKPLI